MNQWSSDCVVTFLPEECEGGHCGVELRVEHASGEEGGGRGRAGCRRLILGDKSELGR